MIARLPSITLAAFFLLTLAVSAEEAAPSGEKSGQLPYARVRVALPFAGRPAEVRETPAQAPQESGPTSAIASNPAPISGPSAAPATPPPLPQPEPLQSMPPPAPQLVEEIRPGAEPTALREETTKSDPLVLAVLDGKPITDLDVMQKLWSSRGRETLDWMIGKAILEKELSRLGLKVEDAEVAKRLREHLDGLAKAFPSLRDPDALTRAASGMRLDEYRERSVWVELALRKIMRSTLKPGDDELRRHYADIQANFIQPEKIKISQIFIAPRPDPDNDNIAGPADWALAEKQILEAHTRLRLGENFAEVAKAYGAGGQMSRWVGRGELLRELEEAAFSIRPGSISTPLRSSMGYHILRSEERRERRLPKFEEVRGEVLAQYEEKLFVLRAGEFMTHLRDNAIRGGGLVISEQPEVFSKKEP